MRMTTRKVELPGRLGSAEPTSDTDARIVAGSR